MIKKKDYFTLYSSKDDEEGTEIEETQFPYYDDNWNLAGYTSKLTERQTGRAVAVVDFNSDGTDGKIRYCPHCKDFGFQYKLGAKIKKKGEPPAPDDELFLSCYECGNTFPLHETHQETKIKDSVQTSSNPFENEPIFLSTDSRATERKKGIKRKSRFHTEDNEDSDIAAEQKRHGSDNVHIIR